MPRGATVMLAALLLGACGGTSNGGGDNDVAPGFKSVIDSLEAQRDCASLQARFDATDDVNEMKYADAAMKNAGCY